MVTTRFEFDPERSKVSIDGTSSLHAIHAAATGVRGWIELELTRIGLATAPRASGEVRIDADRLHSGNSLVDAETRRRIEVRRFPEIIGTVTGSRRLSPDRLALDGDLTLRGETRVVDGELAVAIDGDELRLGGEQRFDVRDWGLQPPRIGLLRVHPHVTVRLEAVGRRT